MQPRCTCGALLPEDARFCHKCGKPQLEEDITRLAAQESTPASLQAIPPPVPPSSGVSFKDSRAVLISILVAAGTLLALVAIGLLLPPLFPVVLCAAGFVAARLYNGRSSQPLSAAGGARLGWMTGLWLFAIVAVMLALTALAVGNPEVWEQAKSMSAQLPQASKEILTLSPHEFLMQLLVGVPFLFFLLTLLPGLGGMIGAKLFRRRQS